ncbi:MAG: hypothetical protein ABI183_21060 [Polyangiaceae bacterium]
MSQTPFNFPCSNCGAHLVVDGSTQTPVCTYCHVQMLLPEEVWERFHPKVVPDFVVPTPRAREKKSILPFVIGPLIAVAIIGGLIGLAIYSEATKLPPIGNAGDACGGRTVACSTDKKANLMCGAGDKLVVSSSCKGPNGCKVSSDSSSITCDYTFADVKDPCDTTDDACSTDHKAELACVAGRYALRATCKGPGGCILATGKHGGSTIACDDHTADLGDPCFDAERTACSTDHKSLLTCTAQKYVVDRACKGPKGCNMTKDIGGKTMTVDCDGPSR